MQRNILWSGVALLMLTCTCGAHAQSAITGATSPPVPGCETMAIGPVYDASIDANATTACFQMVTPEALASIKLDVNMAGFPQGALHDISLVRVDADGTTHAVASDASTDSYRIVQAMSAPSTRWLLLVGRPAGGATVPFQLQAALSEGSDRFEPNDAFAKATTLQGSQVIAANLDNPGDVDNYLVSFRSDQREAILSLEGPGSISADIVDGANRTGTLGAGRQLRVDTSRPVFVSVRGEQAEANSAYTLRVSDPKANAVVSSYYSNENISHLAPGLIPGVRGAANVAREMQVEVTAFEGDHETRLGAGHRVRIYAHDRAFAGNTGTSWEVGVIDAVTDEHGVARATMSISECRGGVVGPIRVQPRLEHPDVWYITYNPISLVHAVVLGADPDAQIKAIERNQTFQHVCKETVTLERNH
ncbi:hypothetical protein SAMN02800692_3371 [Luteibacter sp. UNC138MFCol5.1]|uniref:hypothetical protein n=1 Tax=Luteibacter sp. UNC138MFCol5.1 TaxID=1502774 RepID=UPI0008CF2B59|nr:hypothetical protein [Luteibacter sp. UNC138MFCol5.1]SEP04513.1 hypothetical protein SAMN02800692_3371 [Luteibacter sp. UNC138MFCol5.1]